MHSSPIVNHSKFQKTYECIRHSFFLEGMKKDIHTFVTKCDTFQRNKGEEMKTPWSLQPFPIPTTIWKNISMDFIVGLPKEGNKLVIMVVLNRLSKYAHFFSLEQTFTLAHVSQVFIDQIFKLHGMPTSIVYHQRPHIHKKKIARIFLTTRHSIEHEHNLSSPN